MECCIYEITYADYASSHKGQNALVSVGGLSVGNNSDEVRAVLGAPYSDDNDMFSYYLDDDTYALHFAFKEDVVEYIGFEQLD